MRPLRYRLREFLFHKLIKNHAREKFIEIGYGNGFMLVNLSKLGFRGHGYDPSNEAYRAAQELLIKNNVTGIDLLKTTDQLERYQYIFLFEVIGYFKDPVIEIEKLGENLEDQGSLFFSFAREGSGYSAAFTEGMKYFSKDDISDIVERAGFRIKRIWNYGFPLANILRPLANLSVKFKRKSAGVAQTGLGHRRFSTRLAAIIFNPLVIVPFLYMQLLFKHSALGNGFLVEIVKTQKLETGL